MQAEIIESLVKDREKLTSDFNKLKSEISSEVALLYKQVMETQPIGISSQYDASDWLDQIKMARRSLERQKITMDSR
jgi:archaellum component FlaC